MDPKLIARVYAGGRVLFGVGLLVAPGALAERWIGDVARRPGVRALARSVGVRDVVMGMIALHTVEHPEVGPRWQATCGAVDAVDLVATLAAAADIPATGVIGAALVTAPAAVTGLWLSRALKAAAAADAA